MLKRKINSLLWLVLVSLLFSSCGKKEQIPDMIRSIKTVKVSQRATKQLRKFSGVVYAVNYAYLSFEDVQGRVIKVNVDIGDEVKKGEVLAVLDPQKYMLDVKVAQAQLKKAQASLVKAEADYEREKILFKKGASFQQRLDTRKFQYEAAQSEVNSTQAGLKLAQRNLKNTELKSPYEGFIGERFIQANQEVGLGTRIFRIDEKGDMEVHFKIPESIRKRVTLKMKGSVDIMGHNKQHLDCEISFLGTAASEGNAFPAKALIIDTPKSVKPGMTANISLPLPIEKSKQGFLLPPGAILMSMKKQTGYVYIYNPETSRVHKREVHFAGAQGNLGVISEGLNEGDIVATAGISFLLDGMKVKLLNTNGVSNGAEE
jgi:RND family efflux transporter MFP subunit